MTTSRLFPATNGPAAATAFSGNMITGVGFTVTRGGMWFDGYWVWCCATGQSTNPVKCALWSLRSISAGTVVPGSVVTSGTLTASSWNYVPLPTPVQLAAGDTLLAAVGINGAFPDTQNQFGSGQPFANGIVNGPLTAFSDAGAGFANVYASNQGVFSTAGTDPSTTMPTTADLHSNLWVDVQVDDTAPAGYAGSYRLHPNQAGVGTNTILDTANTFTLATEFHLSQACTVNRVWFYSPAGSTQLPTAAGIWKVGSPATSGSLVVTNTTPAWSGAAGSGWVSTLMPATQLAAGAYKVSVYNGAATPTAWNGAYSNYWGGGPNAYLSPGLNGITTGPLSAPSTATGGICNPYQTFSPFYNAGTTEPGQASFSQALANGGPDAYPHIYADISTGSVSNHYWVDVEVTPIITTGAAAVAAGPATVAATGTFLNMPNESTCAPWALPGDITETDTTGFNQAHLLDCLQAATDVLFQLAGRQYAGICSDTVRPLPRIINRDHGRPVAATSAWTWYAGGGWGYYSGGYMAGYGYSRWGWITTNQEELPDGTTIPSVDLGVFPVTGITQILKDGAVVDPSTYRVDDNRHLVRVINPALDPGGTNNPGWPVQQRMELPPTEKNTWQVTFTYGIPPPTIGKMACAELAYQLYLATTPAAQGQSKLPQRVTSIARQGVNAVVLDPQIFLAEGRTGLIRCDYFLESVNPGKLHRRATMMSVDIKRRVRRTGPVA